MADARSMIRFPIRNLLSDGLHRQAATGATWNLAGTVVSRLVALTTTVVAVRILGPTHFGGLALIQSTAATLATLSGLGLAFATTRFVAECLESDRQRAAGYLTSAIMLCVIGGSVLGLAVIIFSSQLATDVLGRKSLTTAMMMAGPLLLFSPLADVLIGGITGLHKFRALGYLQGMRGVLDGLLLTTGAIAGGTLGAIVGYVAAEAIACLIAGVTVRRVAQAGAIELQFRLHRTILPNLVRFALPSLSTSLLLTTSLWLGQIFLAHQPGGLDSVGVFAYAQRFYLAAMFLPQVIGTVLFPMLSSLTASGQFSRFRRLLVPYLGITLLLATIAACALLLLAGLLASLRGHSGVAESHTLGILAFAAIPSALNNALSQGAVALRRVGWWLFSDVMLAVVLLSVAWLLVPSHGSAGLAVAYLLGYGATCLAIIPAFLNIPKRHVVSGAVDDTSPDSVDCDVELPTVGIADALPNFPTAVSELSPPLGVASPSPVRYYDGQRVQFAKPKQRTSVAAPMAMIVAFLLVVLWSSTRNIVNIDTYPILAIGPFLFAAVQLISPRNRFRRDTPLCPANWGWLLFAIQLILQPALIIIFGPARGQLDSLPGPGYIQESFLLSCLAYVAYAIGLAAILRKRCIERPLGSTWDKVSAGGVAAMIFVGMVALMWRFHSPGQLFSYFAGNFSGQASTSSTSLSGAASTFLRPLGAYGLILLWARSADSGRIYRLRFVLSGAGALVILATYNYNRAAVVIPLVALAAAYGRRIRKLRLHSIVIFGLVILVLAAAFGNYRRVVLGTQGGRISVQQAGITGTPSLESQIQLYGAAPQFSALVIQDLPSAGGFRFGSTIIDSVLSPIPVIGKAFRTNSGTVRYNALVYGHPGDIDQVLPFVGELYWNFGPFGVFVGFLIVGMVIAAFQRRFEVSGGILAAFIFQYLGMWVAFLIVGSIGVVAQIFVYFTLPMVVVALAPKARDLVSVVTPLRVPRRAPGPFTD